MNETPLIGRAGDRGVASQHAVELVCCGPRVSDHRRNGFGPPISGGEIIRQSQTLDDIVSIIDSTVYRLFQRNVLFKPVSNIAYLFDDYL